MATHLVTYRRHEVGSTQDEARLLVESSGDLPLLLIAARQSSGRGRTGRSWLTAPRALACSLVVAPGWRPRHWGTIPLLAGLAARSALNEHCGVRPGLKWPNDLITERGKVGGILVEASDDLAVIGLGVNLWWPDAPEGMAATCHHDPGPDLAGSIAAAWAESVLVGLGRPSSRWGHEDYRVACVTLQSWVTWEPGGRGMAVDVAMDGGLVVETATGRTTLRSGEVHEVRTATVAAGADRSAEGTPRWP